MEIYLDFVFKSLKNLSQVFSLCRRLSRISMDARGKAALGRQFESEKSVKTSQTTEKSVLLLRYL